MEECQLAEIQRICRDFCIRDISFVHTKENPPTSLTELKKCIDRISLEQLSFIFGANLNMVAFSQFVTHLYKRDRELFDFIYDVLFSLPSSIETAHSSAFDDDPLFCRQSLSFQLIGGSNTIAFHVPESVINCELDFSGPVDAMIILGGVPLLSITPLEKCPLRITEHVKLTNNLRITVDRPVILTVTSLSRRPDNEIECEVMTHPVVSGGDSCECCITHDAMMLPVRGINCTHNSNFDLLSYIHLCQERRSWTCPVCDRPLPYEELAVDTDAYELIRQKLFEDTIDLQ